MRKIVIIAVFVLNSVRCLPHLIAFKLNSRNALIESDIKVWLKNLKKDYSVTLGLIFLLSFYPEYRNLFYHRIGGLRYLLNLFCRELSSMEIREKTIIGEGFYINHGYGSVIGAESIGNNCRINQQVTIGDYELGKPVILNNVYIHSGAVIIGNVVIGNNSVIGANATVMKDVPDNSTVFAPLSLTMKWSNKDRFADRNPT